MNGQTQSGGHWKATLGLMAPESVFLGSSGSGEESNIGTLFIMCDTPSRRVAAHQSPLDHGGDPQRLIHIFLFRSLGKSRGRGTGQSSFDHAATGTLIPVGLSQFPCAPSWRDLSAPIGNSPKSGQRPRTLEDRTGVARSSCSLARRDLMVGRDFYCETLDGRWPNDERFYQLNDLLVAFVVVLLCFLP